MHLSPSLSLVFGLFTAYAMGQVPCASPPTCIADPTLSAQGGGDMNSGGPFNLSSWSISHGTPTLFANDSPSNSTGCSIWMWSYSGSGEGVYTCYNFQQGQTYEVCLWVRNTNAITGGGNLQVWMTNGIGEFISPVSPATITDGQLIDASWVNDADWTPLTFTVTPTSTYSQLLLFPYMAGPPINNLQYELQIDDIRVSPVGIAPSSLSIAAQPSVIDPCGSSTLCLAGAPAGSTITWTPAAGLSATTGTCVIATPCTTTTYTATITTTPPCPDPCTPVSGTASVSTTLTVQPIGSTITGLAIAADPPNIAPCSSSTLCLTGAPAGSTITWSPATGLSSTTGACVIASPCATTTYTATVNAVVSCGATCPPVNASATLTATITVQPLVDPLADVGITVAPATIAPCDSATLCLTGVPAGSTILWSPTTGLSNATGTCVKASPCSTTNYTATVTNVLACGNSCPAFMTTTLRTATVTVDPPDGNLPGVGFTVDPQTIAWCDSATLCLTGLPAGSTITWAPADGLSETMGACVKGSPCTTTTYTASVSAQYGCSAVCPVAPATTTVLVTVTVSPPAITLRSEGPVRCGDGLLLIAGQADEPCGSGRWESPSGDAGTGDTLLIDALTPDQLGGWSYRFTHPSGACSTGPFTLPLVAQGTTAEHYLPNAFSPDGDGVNERFLPVSAYGFARYSLLLFDRWGRIVHEVTDATGWDGTSKGGPVPTGIYAWRAEYVLACDPRPRQASGHVMCVR